MNKRKRVAERKHRMKRKKLEERHRREKALPAGPPRGPARRPAGRAAAGGRRERSP
jgi:hypothetical protein